MAHVTVDDLRAYIGTDEVSDFIDSCFSAGNALVGNYIGDIDTVPDRVHDQAILICASELYHRRSAPNGIAQFATADGSPIRVGKDPMTAVYPLLLPFVNYGV